MTLGSGFDFGPRNWRIVAKNFIPSTSTNITTEELIHTLTVPAGILLPGDIIDPFASVLATSSAGTKIFRMHFSANGLLAGATQVAQSVTLSTSNASAIFCRLFPVISDTVIECYAGATGPATSGYGSSISGVSSQVTVPSMSAGFSILFTSQKSNGADSTGVRYSMIGLRR